MKRPCLPLPTIQAATTKILSTKCLNIAEPRIFCPPKITRYTVAIPVYTLTMHDTVSFLSLLDYYKFITTALYNYHRFFLCYVLALNVISKMKRATWYIKLLLSSLHKFPLASQLKRGSSNSFARIPYTAWTKLHCVGILASVWSNSYGSLHCHSCVVTCTHTL